jgi:hypothetical protein
MADLNPPEDGSYPPDGSKKPKAPRPQKPSTDFGKPAKRPLKVYAFDPSRGRLLGNLMSMSVRYQELDPGPIVADPFASNGIAVIDYDATNDVYYEPVDLDDPAVLIRGGLDPTESDPRFHQQMVYAVITDTVQHFEAALGRRIHWRRVARDPDPKKAKDENIYTLNVFPHAMIGANAFYSPEAHGIMFGYFRANEKDQGHNLPGQVVYTCLSHDIIVHETTHAIIDGMRSYFMDRTNPDVAAFHEAFADVAALFRHFSHRDALLDTIQRTGGRLFQTKLASDVPTVDDEGTVLSSQERPTNPLVDLALQFGEATGRGRALRSALEKKPNVDDINTTFECHARGAILVAAIFDAYFTIYQRRTADLFRIFRAGGGDPVADLPNSLAKLLADEASRTADVFFRVCVRALDYCPPVDITFGDYLRALITSDFDVHPVDELGLRDAVMQSFRVRGILPTESQFFSDTAIAWPEAKGFPSVQNLEFGDPNGLTKEHQEACKQALMAYVDEPANRELLGFDAKAPVTISSFHPVFRVNEDGSLRIDLVVEAIQEREAFFDPAVPKLGKFPIRGGATIIITKPSIRQLRRMERMKKSVSYGHVRYVIGKNLGGDAGKQREVRQRNFLARSGLVEGNDPNRFRIDFALTHGGF